MGSMKEKVVDILKKCNDPELPIDLWNLGLIYDLNINQNGDNFDVSILMSLTTPGCTMGQYMMDDMKKKIRMMLRRVRVLPPPVKGKLPIPPVILQGTKKRMG